MNIFYKRGERVVDLAKELGPMTRVADLEKAISRIKSREQDHADFCRESREAWDW